LIKAGITNKPLQNYETLTKFHSNKDVDKYFMNGRQKEEVKLSNNQLFINSRSMITVEPFLRKPYHPYSKKKTPTNPNI